MTSAVEPLEVASAVRFTPARAGLVLGGLLLLTLLALGVSVMLGEYPVQLVRALAEPGSPDGRVLFGLRIPRAVLGALVGASLAASGSALQALLRNSLADPFVLGVSGGAALGATLALALGLQALAGPSLFAFVGAAAAMALVLAAGRARSSPYAALLTGVVFNAFAAAVITCIKTLLTPDRLGEVLYWLAGSLGYERPRTLLVGGLLQLVALGVLWVESARLNLLSSVTTRRRLSGCRSAGLGPWSCSGPRSASPARWRSRDWWASSASSFPTCSGCGSGRISGSWSPPARSAGRRSSCWRMRRPGCSSRCSMPSPRWGW